MFCPKCGTHNLDSAKFCRACGTDISLVPQALTGTLPEVSHGALEAGEINDRSRRRRKRKEKDAPTLEKAFENIFVGMAFLIIFLVGLFFFRRGFMIWIWFIIPALACAGEGIGQLIRASREQQALESPPFKPGAATIASPGSHLNELPDRNTSEIIPPPPSITESTTRHLGAEAPTQHIGARDENREKGD